MEKEVGLFGLKLTVASFFAAKATDYVGAGDYLLAAILYVLAAAIYVWAGVEHKKAVILAVKG